MPNEIWPTRPFDPQSRETTPVDCLLIEAVRAAGITNWHEDHKPNWDLVRELLRNVGRMDEQIATMDIVAIRMAINSNQKRLLELSGEVSTKGDTPEVSPTAYATISPPAQARTADPFESARWFTSCTKVKAGTLRHAANAKRKTKHIRSTVVDGVTLYSVQDAERWWPDDMKKA